MAEFTREIRCICGKKMTMRIQSGGHPFQFIGVVPGRECPHVREIRVTHVRGTGSSDRVFDSYVSDAHG